MSPTTTFLIRSTALGVALGAMLGCAESIAPDPEPDAAGPVAKVQTTADGDGSFTTFINSSSETAWIHAEFAMGTEMDGTTAGWDLRFQRFHISTNGGVSGTAGVEAAIVKRPDGAPAAFAEVTAPPPTGYISDAMGADGPVYAWEADEGWFDYNDETHVLTAKPLVWVVKRAGGAKIKLEIKNYYDRFGTAGWFTLHWAPL
jgi:hypothetical protein